MLLLHALLLALALGGIHVGLCRRGPVPWIPFCALGAAANVVIGLMLSARPLVAQALRAWTTAAWGPTLLVGLFASGAVLAAAWLGAVRGLERLVRRRLGDRAAGPPSHGGRP